MGPHLGHCPSRVAGFNPLSRRRFGSDISRTCWVEHTPREAIVQQLPSPRDAGGVASVLRESHAPGPRGGLRSRGVLSVHHGGDGGTKQGQQLGLHREFTGWHPSCNRSPVRRARRGQVRPVPRPPSSCDRVPTPGRRRPLGRRPLPRRRAGDIFQNMSSAESLGILLGSVAGGLVIIAILVRFPIRWPHYKD